MSDAPQSSRPARHAYFAYGSNLLTAQMLRRCPEADNPRKAVLADHRWLINERGVATVSPRVGAPVHGVVWDVSADDLAALDVAEGVPRNYRRHSRTVRIADGPLTAWVYIDHRVAAGAARPGYLDRVVAGAQQHRLPPSWVALLRRG